MIVVNTAMIVATALFLVWTFGFMVADLSMNPLRWRAERRQIKANARARRIAAMEHELGYTCERDDCYRCTGYSMYRNAEANADWIRVTSLPLPDPRITTEFKR